VPAYSFSVAGLGSCSVNATAGTTRCGGLVSVGQAQVRLPPGRHAVTVQAPGMRDATQNVTLATLQSATLGFTLQNALGNLTVVLPTDAPDNVTVTLASARANATCQMTRSTHAMRCDGDATPAAWPTLRVREGTHALTVSGAGRAPYATTAQVTAGGTTTVRPTLAPLPAPVQVTATPTGLRAYDLVLVQDGVVVKRCHVDLADGTKTSCDASPWVPDPATRVVLRVT
jgi:hypothetical protein